MSGMVGGDGRLSGAVLNVIEDLGESGGRGCEGNATVRTRNAWSTSAGYDSKSNVFNNGFGSGACNMRRMWAARWTSNDVGLQVVSVRPNLSPYERCAYWSW